ncbi:MAG: protein-glutamate O-methyltransferase CheR [Gammaproteobacteria bacterium]|nr:protein-glutamate O-methyltransferase CheR [Gammaproteobacteria bacterium]
MVIAQIHAQMQAPWQYTASPAMDDAQFQQWVALLESRTGITLPATRKTFLVTNLHTRMRELGMTDYQRYYEMVTAGARGQIEWEILVDRLTVHETRFYRDMHALDLIRENYLTPLLEQSADKTYTVNAWSVGCATGEEPYTLAMMMEQLFEHHPNLYYGIVASDISRASLKTGSEAVYHKRRVKNVPPGIAGRYLETVDAEHVRVKESLRHKVCFTHANLLNLESQPVGAMDIILCQNVLIYFRHEIRDRILLQLVTKLKPNGLLVLGAGEVLSWSHPELEIVKHESTLAYRRLPAKGTH